jgi:hypothetical protein
MVIPSAAEKERAKRIIVEIIREAGGSLRNKTNLYKAFYYAHLKYAEENPDYLSAWPIVRMPNGPGIDNFDTLVAELLLTGELHVGTVDAGDGKEAFRFELIEVADKFQPMNSHELAAIKYGVNRVRGKTAAECSEESHANSRSWRSSEDGEELNIYVDSLTDDEYSRLQDKTDRIAGLFKQAAG